MNEKYDWNEHDNLYDSSDEDDTLDESIDFYCDTMSVDTLEDDFVKPTTYDDHDWGDNYDTSCDLENLFESYDESIIDNNVCNIIESGFGEVMTLGSNDSTNLESVQSCDNIVKSGFGEVMTLVNVNPTILEDGKKYTHVDHGENVLYGRFIIEFDYDPTCNYYERGKYGYRNLHVTKLPLYMLKLLMFHSSFLLMLGIACHNNLFAYKVSMHRKWVRLK